MTEPKRCCNPFQRANHSKYKRCNKLDEITSHLHRRYNLPVGKYICEPCRFYAWRMTSHKYKHKKRPERLECPQYWPKMVSIRIQRNLHAKWSFFRFHFFNNSYYMLESTIKLSILESTICRRETVCLYFFKSSFFWTKIWIFLVVHFLITKKYYIMAQPDVFTSFFVGRFFIA